MLNCAIILKNERGTLMILISLMLLALLTIISIAASRTANTEIKIAGNEYSYHRCFYNAEGAVLEAADLLDGDANPSAEPPAWMSMDENIINDNTVFTYWEEGAEKKEGIPQAPVIDSKNTGYLCVHHGVLSGSSLDMSKPTKHTFSIYGRCENRGLVMLKIGYAKVYR